MNKESRKTQIYSQRIKSLQKIAALSQKEVERCLAEIEKAQTQEELDAVQFVAPAVPNNL